jgi:hypothetical protein
MWQDELDARGAAPDPRDPTVMQHAIMDTPEKLAGLLGGSGFTPLRVWSRWFAHQWTAEALFAMQVNCGIPARRLASLPPAERDACRAEMAARLAGLGQDELTYRAEVLFAIARPA